MALGRQQEGPSSVGLPEAGAIGLKSYTPLQLFFLMRLSWMIRQRREYVNVLDPNDWRIKLLNKALYSTFCDCVGEGSGEEAKTLLAQQRQEVH